MAHAQPSSRRRQRNRTHCGLGERSGLGFLLVSLDWGRDEVRHGIEAGGKGPSDHGLHDRVERAQQAIEESRRARGR
ncbi:MAG: hypothetical protein ACO4BU_06780, partial [Phycisphaerales bacterium]